jgi:hypothetical protein
MGRMVGIPHFLTAKAIEEEKMDQAELRKLKALLNEDRDPLNFDEIEDNEDDPVRETQVAIAQRMQGQFEQRILRRTINSKNWEGNPLIVLPPCIEHIVVLRLQPFEQKIHEQLAEKLRKA